MNRAAEDIIRNPSVIRYVFTAALLSALVWAFVFYYAHLEERTQFDRAADKAHEIAVFFERHVLGIFQYGDSYLKMVRREYLRHFDIGQIEQFMEEVPLNKAIASHVTIMDENGVPLLVSGHEIKPGSNASDRDYFQHQKAATGDSLYISRPHKGRNSGKLIVRLVRRFEKPNGEFGGVMFLALEAKHITEFFITMQVGPKSSATLVGDDRYLRARSNWGPKGYLQDISGSRIWKELELSPTGLYRQLSVVDSITRYYAYRRVEGFPLIVAIGLAVEDFEHNVDHHRLGHYAFATLATLLILVTALYFFRQHQLLGQIQVKNDELERRADEIELKNRELQSQNAELERFNYTVSHDLKAPLVTIKGFLGLLQKDINEKNNDAMSRDLDQISDAADQMAQLLDELLELSRIGRQMNAPEERDLTGLVQEALERVSIQLEEKGIDLRVADDMPAVRGDPGRLLEIFQNLVDNAVKFMGEQESPCIEIGARRDNGEVHCFVRDNGIGIAHEYHERVFGLFDRLDARVEGTGVGLALVKRIVEIHGGQVWIESEGEGRGSTFHFTLPAAD